MMREDPTTVSLLTLLERLHEPIQLQIDETSSLAQPGLVPVELLTWLSYFVAVPETENLPEAKRRKLVADLGRLVLRRGTAEYLSCVVEALVDGEFEINESGGVFLENSEQIMSSEVVIMIEGTILVPLASLKLVIESVLPAHCSLRLDVGSEGSL